MTLNDIYAAQIEAHFYFYIWSGAFFTILYLIVWYGFKRVAEAVSQQKVVIREVGPGMIRYYQGWPPQLSYWPPVSNPYDKVAQ